MLRVTLFSSLCLLAAGFASASEPVVASTVPAVVTSTVPLQACQDASQAACTSPPAWQAELELAQKSWSACQKEIEQFCEGIQVGEGRLEHCLKSNQKKLSPACRKSPRSEVIRKAPAGSD